MAIARHAGCREFSMARRGRQEGIGGGAEKCAMAHESA
jgi:hypothetical protein